MRISLITLCALALAGCARAQSAEGHAGGLPCRSRSAIPNLVSAVTADSLVGVYYVEEVELIGGVTLALRADGTTRSESALCGYGGCTEPHVAEGRWVLRGGEVVVTTGTDEGRFLVHHLPEAYRLIAFREGEGGCVVIGALFQPVR